MIGHNPVFIVIQIVEMLIFQDLQLLQDNILS